MRCWVQHLINHVVVCRVVSSVMTRESCPDAVPGNRVPTVSCFVNLCAVLRGAVACVRGDGDII